MSFKVIDVGTPGKLVLSAGGIPFFDALVRWQAPHTAALNYFVRN